MRIEQAKNWVMMRFLMKVILMFVIAPFLVIGLVITPSSEETKTKQEFLNYLPQSGELEEWQPVGSPQKFVGENLYSLINGGAVIYYEYGFKQIITQEYVNKNEKFINVEIFEMTSPASAYGIYTFKTSYHGKQVPVGTEALLEDYYLNFWKGNFLITLTAFDSEKDVLNDLLTIAKTVNTKIEDEGQRPLLTDLLLKENLKPFSIKYLKGYLALSNNYDFDPENIFGLKQGVIGNYGDYKIFIFKYDDKDKCLKRFKNAMKHMEDNSRFNDFTNYENDFSMIDRNGEYIYIRHYQNYIFIYLGKKEIDPRVIFEKIQDKIE